MKNRLWKRISAACLTAMVAVSMLGITAFAEEGETDTTTNVTIDTVDDDNLGTVINISKIVSTDGDTYEPNTTFTFTLTEYTDTDDGTCDYDDNSVASTLSNVLTLVADTYDSDDDGEDDASRSSVTETSTGATGTITYEPGDVGDGSTYTYYEIYGYVSSTEDDEESDSSGSKDGGLYLVLNTPELAETYYYTLTETTGSYEGIIYDTTTYYLAVTYTSDDDGIVSLSSVVAYKNSANDKSAKAGSIVFDNSYGTEGTGGYDNPEDPDDPDDPYNTTHDIEIFKEVEGDGADDGELFDFYVSVVDNGTNSGEWYKVVYRETSSSEDVVTYVVAGGSIRVQIGATGSIQVYGLTNTDKVTIYEADYSGSGYETTISAVYVSNEKQSGKATSDNDSEDTTIYYSTTNGTGLTTSESTTTSIYGTLKDDGVSATITNTRNANVITGVVMTVGPYIALIAAAVVLLLVVSRRRREVEY